MATNDFLPFAYGGGANVLSQAAYAALTSLLSGGYQSGVANSAQMNKTWRQSSIMAAVLGQFAADYSGQNSTDDGTTATLEANLVSAIRSATKTGVILADTGAANAYTAVNVPPLTSGTWVDGVVQQVKIAHANNSASTYAPDGLPPIPIYGLGLQPLQGGELALNGTAIMMRATITGVNSGNPIAVLMECAGGAQQVAPATQSQHALQLGQTYYPNLLFNGSGEFGNAGYSFTNLSAFSDALGGVGTFFANGSSISAASSFELSPAVPVGPGVKITCAFDIGALGVSAGQVAIYLQPYNSSGGSLASDTTVYAVPNGASVTRQSVVLTTPANTAYVRWVAAFTSVTAAAYGIVFKRVKIEAGSTPSIYSQEANLVALGTGPNSAPVFVGPATQSQHAMQLGQAVGRLLNIQIFTANATYTPTAGTTSVVVEAIGGGGGSGGTSATSSSTISVTGGGGAGAYARARFTSGFSGAAITIGAAGTAGASSAGNGGTGGTTSFGALLSCAGGTGSNGRGAFAPSSISAPGGGASQPASGNIVRSRGQDGGNGLTISLTDFISGVGGNTPFGAGGTAVNSTSPGSTATTFGAGAGGATSGISSAAQAGGAGAPGVVIVYEYA
ncbi:hypothetical protein SAMD00023378_3882 [Ralstonia sp. NT80]|uniref:glycine-rich domain-containing protein n=1 Tax=Ralstonia sp. NT80 TaxID=1218247 RepID=UPI00066E83C6|nr:hypothetical protein [Ralstonia sp. NT80]GAQ30199.1 hypothetical protein SAMD00023378_3882 [Ralstonia sp. NT80]